MVKKIVSKLPRYTGSTNRSTAKKTTAASGPYGPKSDPWNQPRGGAKKRTSPAKKGR